MKRAYEPSARSDGYRVLVDRLWPRGVHKEELHVAAWEKEIAPSPGLRKWFGHDPARWKEFQKRYRHELEAEPAAERLAALAKKAKAGTVTLVFSAHDEAHNNAVVLQELLKRSLRG